MINTTAIWNAFNTAKKNGIQFPKLHLGDYIFSPAGTQSKNAGAVYVKRADTREYLGKIMIDGRFYYSTLTAAEILQIAELVEHPGDAAVAYGRKTGVCSCCGRSLTNALSVQLGIGPICREKYGWVAEIVTEAPAQLIDLE